MNSIRKGMVTAGLVVFLSVGVPFVPIASVAVAAEHHSAQHAHSGFNDEYIFATTRGVNDWDDVHPALKLTLFPVTIILDTVFLPFAVMAGFVA